MSNQFARDPKRAITARQATNAFKAQSRWLLGHEIVPSTCGDGYHVKRDGKVIREDRHPRRFAILEAAQQYILQQTGTVPSET